MRADMKALLGLRRTTRDLQAQERWDHAHETAYACGVLEAIVEDRTDRMVKSIVGRLNREAHRLPRYGDAAAQPEDDATRLGGRAHLRARA